MPSHRLAVVLAGLFVVSGVLTVGAADPSAYVIEPSDILRIEINGLPENGQPANGGKTVGPDGTVSVGGYGSVFVSGMTTAQARAAIVKHLATHVKTMYKLEAEVEVSASNSKVYYVIDSGEDQVYRFPIKGEETAASAVLRIEGLADSAAKEGVWVASPPDQFREVDWRAITQEGRLASNYRLSAGDRVYVGGSPLR